MVMHPKDADSIANSEDPGLLWVFTICLGQSVRKLRIITVAIFVKYMMSFI